jgi:hypothetical protein
MVAMTLGGAAKWGSNPEGASRVGSLYDRKHQREIF